MKLLSLLTAPLAVLLAAMPALAQQAQGIANAPQAKRVIATLIALGLTVFIAIAAFMTPKRGHQD